MPRVKHRVLAGGRLRQPLEEISEELARQIDPEHLMDELPPEVDDTGEDTASDAANDEEGRDVTAGIVPPPPPSQPEPEPDPYDGRTIQTVADWVGRDPGGEDGDRREYALVQEEAREHGPRSGVLRALGAE